MSDLRILIADDDHDFAESIAEIFEMKGFQVEIVFDGQAAVDSVLSRRVDVLIMDLCMPKKSGKEVISELRSKGQEIPTIIITACGEDEAKSVSKLGELSIKGVLSKPLNPDVLLKMVDDLTSMK
ncbi:response regulator [bacterium]|nr:response regulator [bacterium]